MKRLAVVFLPLLFLWPPAARAEHPAPPKPLVLVHVTVIDGTGAPPRPDQTVAILGERITGLGKTSEVSVPPGAQVLEAGGKFLIPGLWDMHTHVVDRATFLPLCLANGIIGIREMGNFPDMTLALRNDIAAGKVLGPRMVVAGPILDGPKPVWPFSIPVTNTADGRKAVDTLKKRGVDFIKVYSKLPRDGFLAITAEARKQGLPVAGHVPEAVSAAEASDAGQNSMEHLLGIPLACSSREAEQRKELTDALARLDNRAILPLINRVQAQAADSYSPEKAAALFARLVKNRTWQCPTLTVQRALGSLNDPALTNDPRLKYITPFIRRLLWSGKPPAEWIAGRRAVYQRNLQFVRDMHRAGVAFLAGTDTPNPYCFPGFSLHDELALLVQAGFTPMEALQCATRDAAQYLDRLRDLGTIECGKLADLVLLDANPLDDIHNTRKIAAVVVGGKLLPRSELDAMLARVEAACGGKAVAERPAARSSNRKEGAWTPDAILRSKQVSGVQVSPDGKRVVYSVRQAVMDGEKSEFVNQLHIANIDGSDAFPLTYGEKSSDNPEWSPDGQWIAFTSARSGKNNLWLLRTRGGEAQRLTDVKSGVGSFKWSPDGKQIAFTAPDPPTAEEERRSKEKNDARVVDADIKLERLYVMAVEPDAPGKRTARQLTRGHYSVGSLFGPGGFDWSPDGKTIAFTHTRTPKPDDWPTADISVVDVASGTVKPLANTPAAEHSPRYSPDGRWIAYLASDTPPHWAFNFTVHVVPAAGGTPRPLATTFDRRPQLLGWSADGQKLYYLENHGTAVRLYALPLHGQPEAISPAEGVLTGASLNRGHTHLGFTREGLDQAPEAYVSGLDRFAPVRVSHVNKDLPQHPLGRTEVLRWKAPDGLEVEGLLTYPVDYEKGKRYPLLLVIHGGPAGVYTQNFVGNPSPYPLPVFASRGYAVLRCNPRGSSGYGWKFRSANYKDWGGGDFRDLMAGVDHVIEMGIADGAHLGVMGWSYGGFMTSWIITQTPRFRAASVGAGVTNVMSFTGTTDIPGFAPDYFGAEPWDNLEVYRAHSAMFHVKGVRTPTLIQHGEKDERVPISQGYELYNALKQQGCPVKMVVYPRTPHGPREPKLLLDIMKRNVAWFDEHVRRE